MPHTVTLEEARAHLDDLIAEVGRGREVVIMDQDRPVARLGAPDPALPDRFPLFGLLKGKIEFREGWDEPLEEMRPYMERHSCSIAMHSFGCWSNRHV